MTVREMRPTPLSAADINQHRYQPARQTPVLAPLVRAGLEPYTGALNDRRIDHLLRRAAIGASRADIERFRGKTASEVVDALILEATETLPLPEKPPWADIPMPDRKVNPPEDLKEFSMNNRDWLNEFRIDWMSWLQKGGLRERMALFWHNHFVTGVSVYELSALAYRYVKLLRMHGLGNFKDFVYDIGLTPAMLVYLNGVENEKNTPNENYARELLELFTMSPESPSGQPNYSQNDIEEMARALTGWDVNYTTYEPFLEERRFDDGVKSFLGKSGSFGYDDVVNVVFQQRPAQIAYFICWKIYREFVYDTVDETIVKDLADIFLDNNFEILPVVSTLLKSAHFFDQQFIGAKVKSPIELLIGFFKEVDFVPANATYEYSYRSAMDLNQTILDPPDVSGWDGHRSWLSTNTLPVRWSVVEFLLFSGRNNQALDLVTLAGQFPEASDPLAAFKLPVALAEHFMSVPLNSLDLGEIDEDFDGDLVSNPIPEDVANGPAYARTLAKVFLGGVPWYEWSIEENGVNSLLLNYVQYLTLLPEFHLT